MVNSNALLRASIDAGKEFFRAPGQLRASAQSAPLEANLAPALAKERRPVMVPIRSLGLSHIGRIAAHLLALDPNDRYLRFG